MPGSTLSSSCLPSVRLTARGWLVLVLLWPILLPLLLLLALYGLLFAPDPPADECGDDPIDEPEQLVIPSARRGRPPKTRASVIESDTTAMSSVAVPMPSVRAADPTVPALSGGLSVEPAECARGPGSRASPFGHNPARRRGGSRPAGADVCPPRPQTSPTGRS